MKPGKKATPLTELDIRKLWAALGEQPPGPIREIRPPTVRNRKGAQR